jgi:hypothetical protein
MGDWDFLHGLSGQELEDAMSSGATAEEWAWIEAQQEKKAQQTEPNGKREG